MEGYCNSIEVHILPYFENKAINSISQLDYDNFFVHLAKKKVSSSKYEGRNPEDIPCLSTATINKVKIALGILLDYALDWKYIKVKPKLKAPPVKYKKTGFWSEDLLLDAFERIEDEFLHLVFHLCLVGSMRAGEVVGIEIHNIDLKKNQLRIEHGIERIGDDELKLTNNEGIKFVFPKKVEESDSSLVLKRTKNDKSDRKIPITEPLKEEIKKRLEQIKEDKVYNGPYYQDYGLLICYSDGTPIEVNRMNKLFKKWQEETKFEKSISMQGLRKSAQMFKKRMEGADQEKVALQAGQTTAVMNKHYDEPIDADLVDASQKLDINYYAKLGVHKLISAEEVSGTSNSYKALLAYLEPSETSSLYNRDGVPIKMVQALVKMVMDNPKILENALTMYESIKANIPSQEEITG